MARILIITLATVALVAAFASAQRQTTPDDSGDTYDIEDERCKFGAKDRNKEFVNEKGHKCTCKAQWWGQNARCVRRVRTTTTTVPTTTTTTTTTTVPTTSTESTTTTTAATTQKPNTYVEKRSNCTNDKEGQEYVNEDGDRCKCERMFSPVHGYNARCTRTKNGTNEATTSTSAGTTTTTTVAPTTRTTTVPTTRKTTVKPDNYRENNKNCTGFNRTKGEFVNKEGDKCHCLPFSLFRHYNTQCTRNRTNNSTTTTIAPTTTTTTAAPETTTTTTEEPATTTTTTEAVTTTTTEEAVTTTTTEEAVTTTTTEEAVTTTTEEAVTTTTEAAPTTTTEEIITAETSISE